MGPIPCLRAFVNTSLYARMPLSNDLVTTSPMPACVRVSAASPKPCSLADRKTYPHVMREKVLDAPGLARSSGLGAGHYLTRSRAWATAPEKGLQAVVWFPGALRLSRLPAGLFGEV
ncbi:hypothetical protein ACFLT5_04075 [Chloroflexota bacterium]